MNIKKKKRCLAGALKQVCFVALNFALIGNSVAAVGGLGNKDWDRRFGGTGFDFIKAVAQTADGGYILGAYSDSNAGGDKSEDSRGKRDYWAVKINAGGIKEWDRRFGGSESDFLSTIAQTSDGGYILGGNSSSDANGDKTQDSRGESDYWVVKINAAGVKEWDRRFGGNKNDNFYDLVQTSDGGYILGGESFSGAGGDKTQDSQGASDYWIVKISAAGAKEWDKRFGGSGFDSFRSLSQTADGGYILGGSSSSGAGGDKTQDCRGGSDYWMVKINAAGVKEWDKRFGGNFADTLHSLAQTSDGGYILGGSSSSGAGGDKTQDSRGGYDYWVVKADAAGTKVWDRRFGGDKNDDLYDLAQSSDGGYILGGESSSGANGDKTQDSRGGADFWVVKINAGGDREEDKRFGGTVSDYCTSLTQTSDGGYILGGGSNSDAGGDKTQDNYGFMDTWVVKMEGVPLTTRIPVATPNQLTFGDVEMTDTKVLKFVISNTGNSPLTVTGLSCPQGFYANWIGTIAPGEDSQEISTIFKPMATAAYVANITINCDNTGGDTKVTVRGTGTPIPAQVLSPQPESLIFGYVEKDSTNSLTFVIKNNSNGPLTVTGLNCPAGFSGDWSGTIAAYGSSPNIPIEFSPVLDRRYRGDITINCSVPENNTELAVSGRSVTSKRMNDFNDDGVSDLGILDQGTGRWFIETVGGRQLGFSVNWGWPGVEGVAGDYDGDGKADLAIFDQTTGRWFIRALAGDVILWEEFWGWPGVQPVAGDYDGDGKADLAVFDQNTGRWFIKRTDRTVILWDTNWGWPGVQPVAGDYNGDGIDDLAILDQATGRWFIRSVTGEVLAWDINWGWPGVNGISGDFDGDDKSDLAICNTKTGQWFIYSLTKGKLGWDINRGWSGIQPVSGDFDGDGADDLAIFDESVSRWFIRSLDGTVGAGPVFSQSENKHPDLKTFLPCLP